MAVATRNAFCGTCEQKPGRKPSSQKPIQKNWEFWAPGLALGIFGKFQTPTRICPRLKGRLKTW